MVLSPSFKTFRGRLAIRIAVIGILQLIETSQSATSSCEVTEDRSKMLKPCKLPFTFRNRVYTSCTTVNDPDDKHWCSTQTDEDGDHVGKIGAWGHCDMTNPACNEQLSDDTPANVGLSGTWKPSATKGECGATGTFESIVGGQVTKPGEYPYMVLLGSQPREKDVTYYGCGGSLINRFYVLTAAHCHTEAAPILNALIGEHIIGTNPDCTDPKIPRTCLPSVQDIAVLSVKTHEDWNQEKFFLGNDIALVRLAKSVILAFDSPSLSRVTPVCLPWKPNDPGSDLSQFEEATVTGWGRVTNNLTEAEINLKELKASSRVLMKADIVFADEARCKEVKSSFDRNKQICAGGEKDVDSCQGDSGGPLVVRENPQGDDPWFLVGIVSFGTKKCGNGVPGVYTKVTNYLNWIDSNLQP